ncbi:hypothetical protein VN12_25935 [Pirellula sp. SH-Sr6A]|uniref:hypothetical protein n=1 Tax=Pirellula sp. SH-Sr6A TaxID=1632865 RepID=UPI00078BD103|nr:hypothetical protein [Pirellula sp. SH-Sr6A]AMV35559.1 hypothetical protein VN12_25935 [Pirellula sp. SH-Sr6A]
MLIARMTVAVLIFVACAPCVAIAQESISDLKQRIEQLEAKVQLLEKSISMLFTELDKGTASGSAGTGTSGAPKMAESTKPPVNDQSDPFRVGVTWVGDVAVKSARGTAKSKWAISISERDGTRFAGGLVIGMPDGQIVESPVSGTAPTNGDGLITLETPLIGRAKSFARGRVQNGEIALTVKGTTKLGEDVVGSATLRPKN